MTREGLLKQEVQVLAGRGAGERLGLWATMVKGEEEGFIVGVERYAIAVGRGQARV